MAVLTADFETGTSGNTQRRPGDTTTVMSDGTNWIEI